MSKKLGPIGTAIKEAHSGKYTDGLLNTREAAAVLRLAPATLETRRSIGGGPPYIKFGSRRLYRLEDLAAWVDSRSIECE